ncbi:hypothetical protein YC2023_056097 [Brassica napus]
MEYVRRPPALNSQRSEISIPSNDHREQARRNSRSRLDWRIRQDNNNSIVSNSHIQKSERVVLQETNQASPGQATGGSHQRQNGSVSSHTPPPLPPRERMDLSGNSNPTESGKSSERRSALLRLAEPDLRDQLPKRSSISGESRLHEVIIGSEGAAPLGSPPGRGTSGPSAQVTTSPTVEQVRAPASQRLGGLASLGSKEKTRATLNQIVAVTSTKRSVAAVADSVKAPKRRTTASRRVARSPMQGINLRKVNIARSTNPPRKRICTEKGRTLPWNKASYDI